jgi:hypothetical protein
VDVESNPEFISCCGPDEWIVCNCLSGPDRYLRSVQTGNSVESKESEEIGGAPDGALPPQAIDVSPPREGVKIDLPTEESPKLCDSERFDRI